MLVMWCCGAHGKGVPREEGSTTYNKHTSSSSSCSRKRKGTQCAWNEAKSVAGKGTNPPSPQQQVTQSPKQDQPARQERCEGAKQQQQ